MIQSTEKYSNINAHLFIQRDIVVCLLFKSYVSTLLSYFSNDGSLTAQGEPLLQPEEAAADTEAPGVYMDVETESIFNSDHAS